MKSIHFIFFEGISWTSKLIKWWTRSNFSHSAFINPMIYDGTVESLYKFGSIIESWPPPGEKFWNARCIFSSLKAHTPGTPFEILQLNVSDNQFQKVLEFQRVCAYLEVPYDWKAIIAFVIPRKLKKNGYLFCSEKDCLSLKYANVFSNSVPCWKVSPDRLHDMLLVEGAKVVYRGKVSK